MKAEAGAGPSRVNADDEKKQEVEEEMLKIETDDEDEDSIKKDSGFVPGPLLSLKEQIEKDKVFLFFNSLLCFFTFK